MGKLSFDFEWVNPGNARGEELSATWGSLAITFDGYSITEAYNAKSKTVTDRIYLPLYPLAEWLALNWWFLNSEVYNPMRTGYEKRHNIIFAQDGYALPSFSIMPTGTKARLIWEKREKKFKQNFQTIKFLNEGEGIVDMLEFQEDLSEFIDLVVSRLDELNINGTLLQEEWAGIKSADYEEIEYCKLSASAGIDPYGTSESLKNAIFEVEHLLPKSIVPEFFTICNANEIINEAEITLDILTKAHSISHHFEGVKKIREHFFKSKKINLDWSIGTSNFPWATGYKAAQDLRLYLGKKQINWSHLTEAEESFVEKPDINILMPRSIDAISGFNKSEELFLVCGRATSRQSKRFTFYRTLYEYLFSNGNDSFLITKSQSENQKRNRAFAAEFLMPTESLAIEVKRYGEIGGEEIDEIAEKFDVSPMIVEHQMANHHIANMGDNYL